MGSVKIDIKKGEREWENVGVNTPDGIKGLLKFRGMFDPTFNFSDESMKIMDDTDYSINYEAIHTYIELDKFIESANLSPSQLMVLDLYQKGLTELDIGEKTGRTFDSIKGTINSICNKIHREYIEDWKSYIYLNVVRTPYEYKECIRCLEFKPKQKDYFRSRSDKKGDGFYNICKKCEK